MQEPASPHLAARLEGVSIDVAGILRLADQFQPAQRRQMDDSRARAQRDADNSATAREHAFNEERLKAAIKEKEERERIARAKKAQDEQKTPPKKDIAPTKSPPKAPAQKPAPKPAAPNPARPPAQKPKSPPPQERPRNR